MSRHRVGVRNPDGAVLRSSSAEIPDDMEVHEGATFIVEASVPLEPRRNQRSRRDERHWRLKACPDALAVLKLGGTRGRGHHGYPGIEIRVEGAQLTSNSSAHD
jgi:hypothetical protein